MTRPASSRTLLLLLVLSILTVSTLSSSSTSSSSSYYSSIKALDKYGNSIQLSHAREASQQHGTLVLVGIANEGNIVCVSVSLPPKIGTMMMMKMSPSSESQQQQQQKRMMHPISKSNTGSGTVMMICTGIKADIRWLVQTMREYQARTWERYDAPSSSSTANLKRVTWALSQVLLDFMGYARNREWMDGVGPVLMSTTKNDRSSSSWSRPLGVQTLVVSYQTPYLTLLDPSGVVMADYNAYALGRDSPVCLDELELLYTPTLTTEELQELFVDIVQRKVIDENPTMYDKAELCIETLTEHGVEHSIRIPTITKKK